MKSYKNDFINFAENRRKCFEEAVGEDILPKFEDAICNYDIRDVETELVDQCMNKISTVITNPNDLSSVLQEVISLHKMQLHEIIVFSDLMPQIMDTFRKYPHPHLIQAICDLICFSSKLSYQLFKFNLIDTLYAFIFSKNLEISYEALKFIYKIIPHGIINVTVLYGSGIFNVLLRCLQDNPPLLPYVINTVLLFIIYDPVYGKNSYSKIGGKLPKRNLIMNQCREINIPVKIMFNISSFLKHGNGECPNKQLYHIINLLLMSNNENMSLYAIKIIELLSLYCKENALKILTTTQFLNFASLRFNCNNVKIQVSIFNTIRNIIFYQNYAHYEKAIINLNPFLYGLDIICAENAPTELKVAAGRCIFYGIKNIDFIQNQFNDDRIFGRLYHAFQNSEMKVRAEICCIIILLLINCVNGQEIRFLSNDLIISLIDYLGDYDDEQKLIVLQLFYALSVQYCDIMINILSNDDTIDILDQLSSNPNSDIAEISDALIELLTKHYINDDDNDDSSN